MNSACSFPGRCLSGFWVRASCQSRFREYRRSQEPLCEIGGDLFCVPGKGPHCDCQLSLKRFVSDWISFPLSHTVCGDLAHPQMIPLTQETFCRKHRVSASISVEFPPQSPLEDLLLSAFPCSPLLGIQAHCVRSAERNTSSVVHLSVVT